MIIKWPPWKILIMAGVMLAVSVVLPLLMVLQIIESTLFLNFLAFALSVAGMLIGFIGAVFYVKIKRQ
jgi:hypothetical protein